MLNLFYLSGQAGGVGLLAFGIIWYRQTEHLPSALGFLKLFALFSAVVVISTVTYIILLVGTEFAGDRKSVV